MKRIAIVLLAVTTLLSCMREQPVGVGGPVNFKCARTQMSFNADGASLLFTIEADGLGQVELYNSNGQQVANLRGRDNKTTVNTELLPSGVYTIHAITAHGNAVRKVLVLPRQ